MRSNSLAAVPPAAHGSQPSCCKRIILAALTHHPLTVILRYGSVAVRWRRDRDSMRVGYALALAMPSGHEPAFDVSLDTQIDALTQAGCTRIHTDAVSDRHRPRKGWKDVLAYVSAGDTLVGWRLASCKGFVDQIPFLAEERC